MKLKVLLLVLVVFLLSLNVVHGEALRFLDFEEAGTPVNTSNISNAGSAYTIDYDYSVSPISGSQSFKSTPTADGFEHIFFSNLSYSTTAYNYSISCALRSDASSGTNNDFGCMIGKAACGFRAGQFAIYESDMTRDLFGSSYSFGVVYNITLKVWSNNSAECYVTNTSGGNPQNFSKASITRTGQYLDGEGLFMGGINELTIADNVLYCRYNSTYSCTLPAAPVTTFNFSVSAFNGFNGSSFSDFNVSINNVSYSTSSGKLVTAHMSNDTDLINITIMADRVFNYSVTNLNTSSNLSANMSQYPSIYLTNVFNGSNLTNFNVTINNYTYLSVGALVFIPLNSTQTMLIQGSNYLNQSLSMSILQNTLYQVNMSQSQIIFNCVKGSTGINLNCANYSLRYNPGLYNFSVFLNASVYNNSYNIYYNNFSISALDNYTLSVVFPYPNLNITQIAFSVNNGLNISPVTQINVSCSNILGPNVTLNTSFNNAKIFFGNATNSTNYINQTLMSDGYNTLSVVCSDALGNVSSSLQKYVYVKSLCLIDEVDNTAFNSANISSSRVYFDDNSSYYDFKALSASCVNYTSLNTNDKLRFELKYATGVVITRYVDTSIIASPIRVCANKEGVVHYQQIITSAIVKPVIMKSVFANCVIAADYTRFAYQDTRILTAYSINTLYYLYTLTNNVQTFLASIDGSISTYINLDTLEFGVQDFNLNIQDDTIGFEQIAGNITKIYYKNMRGNNINASITIDKLNNGVTYFSSTSFADPNEITILFDYSTLNVNSSTIFRVTGIFCKIDGSCSTIKQYFNTMGKSGYLNPVFAFIVSLFLTIFGLSLSTSKSTFGFFGLIVMIGAVGILSFALMTWYVKFLLVIEIIIGIYIVMNMIYANPKDVLGVN